ncbi:hypothetical protein V2J09_008614 [Rumex salicifolius]
MASLNQLFSRGLIGGKCKTCLNLAISRIKLQQNRRDLQLKAMRKEIAQFLHTGQEAIARIRVEHVIREQNVWDACEILELFCEFLLARVPIIESQRECPPELREAIASIIFAAPRCSDLPDLLQIRNLFATKYGKEFVSAASELRPGSGIIEKLSASVPSKEERLKLLKEIAHEHNLEWDSSKTEAEFNKQHADLLHGSRHVSGATYVSDPPTNQHLPSSTPTKTTSIVPPNTKGSIAPQSPIHTNNSSSSINSEVIGLTVSGGNRGPINDSHKEIASHSQPCDVMEMARAAIDSAERAAASARAAALLVNSKYGSTR